MISLIVSLTLSPALAALVLKPRPKAKRRAKGAPVQLVFRTLQQRLQQGFARLCESDFPAGSRRRLMLAALSGDHCLLTAWRIEATPVGFIPAAGPGQRIDGRQLCRTAPRWHAPMLLSARAFRQRPDGRPGIAGASSYAGVDAPTQHTNSNRRPDLPDRSRSQIASKTGLTFDKIVADLEKRLRRYHGAVVRIFQPPPVRGIGTTGRFEADHGGPQRPGRLSADQEITRKSRRRGFNRIADISGAFVTFNTDTPRIFADIDRTKAEYLGVPDSAKSSTRCRPISARAIINDFNLFNHTYPGVCPGRRTVPPGRIPS